MQRQSKVKTELTYRRQLPGILNETEIPIDEIGGERERERGFHIISVEDAPTNKIKHNQIESDRECSPIFPCKLLGSLWCRMFS